ncbi:MAG TPA: hypothetical protein VGR57_08265 [Ktedonobacterales bacterium]|nr:hypothetical protein [Ktedonobacterales bacterium]
MDNFVASYVISNPHGLVLYGNPGATAQPIGPAGGYALYYVANGSHTVQTIATPTPAADGTVRGILVARTSGDWVAYVIADGNEGHWELWVLNVLSDERRMIDSAPADAAGLRLGGDLALDGADLVYSAAVLPNGSAGAVEHVFRAYHLATGQVRTLMSGPSTPIIFPRAMANGAVFFTESQGNTPAGSWLWVLSDAAPHQISSQIGPNAAMNDHYIVWDDPSSRSLSLYDRATNRESDGIIKNCIRPALPAQGPYGVCVDFDRATYRAFQLPSGQNSTFFDHQAGSLAIAIAGSRAYWVAGQASNVIDYLDMPTI